MENEPSKNLSVPRQTVKDSFGHEIPPQSQVQNRISDLLDTLTKHGVNELRSVINGYEFWIKKIIK